MHKVLDFLEERVIRDRNKKASGISGLGIDITERGQAEEALRKRKDNSGRLMN